LPQKQRNAAEGVFSQPVGKLWCGAFDRARGSLAFISFGYLIPEFYDESARLRKAVGRTAR